MRIVQERIVPAGAGRLRSGDPGTQIKDYFERIGLYVPAEVIAAFISVNALAMQTRYPGTWFTVIFIACLVCTPVYITRFTTTRKEAWFNGVISTAAFIVWAYASGGGFFKYIDWYDQPTASIILVLFSLVSGGFEPKTKQKPLKPEIIPSPPSQPAQ